MPNRPVIFRDILFKHGDQIISPKGKTRLTNPDHISLIAYQGAEPVGEYRLPVPKRIVTAKRENQVYVGPSHDFLFGSIHVYDRERQTDLPPEIAKAAGRVLSALAAVHGLTTHEVVPQHGGEHSFFQDLGYVQLGFFNGIKTRAKVFTGREKHDFSSEDEANVVAAISEYLTGQKPVPFRANTRHG